MTKIPLFFAIGLTLLSSPMVGAVEQTQLTEQQIAKIKTNCSSALQGLLSVERSDAVTRVNRGQEYESTLKLLAAFNSRVVLNKLDAPQLTSTTAKMQQTFTSFQKNYLLYADAIDATLQINCKLAPVTFYDNLTATREARARVAADVSTMNSLFDEYQRGLDALKSQLNPVSTP